MRRLCILYEILCALFFAVSLPARHNVQWTMNNSITRMGEVFALLGQLRARSIGCACFVSTFFGVNFSGADKPHAEVMEPIRPDGGFECLSLLCYAFSHSCYQLSSSLRIAHKIYVFAMLVHTGAALNVHACESALFSLIAACMGRISSRYSNWTIYKCHRFRFRTLAALPFQLTSHRLNEIMVGLVICGQACVR